MTPPTTGTSTPSKENPTLNREIIPNPGSTVHIQPDLSQSFPIDESLISFNTGFMFTAPIEKEPEVKKISQALQPKALRFPGGTIASYYHPDGKGYGFRESELQGKFPEVTRAMPLFEKNAIYHFADLCKMSNSSVIYVANLLTGTVEEAIWAIDYLHSQKIPVIGIELGNEFSFQIYQNSFPTVESYIQKAKAYAQVLRKKYPNIHLGVVAGNATEPNPKNALAKFQNEWNSKLGKENFYDFYIPHLYTVVTNCETQNPQQLEKLFECAATLMSPSLYNYHQVVLEHYKGFYGNKKMWITEWNMDGSGLVSNTILHAAYVAEFLLETLDAKQQYPFLENAIFHNYGSGGFVAPIFSYSNDTKNTYLKKSGKIVYNSTYFSFLYYKQLALANAKRIREKISYPAHLSNKEVICKTFISEDKSLLYIYFINKSSQNITYELDGAKEVIKIEGIYGKYLWSVAGLNGIHSSHPTQVDLIQQIPSIKNSQDYTIPGNSIGYIVIRLG